MIYLWTEGIYSDFYVVDVFEGPDGLDMDEIKKRFVAECPPDWQTTSWGGLFVLECDKFRKWAEQTYGLRSLDYDQLDVGSKHLMATEGEKYGLTPPTEAAK